MCQSDLSNAAARESVQNLAYRSYPTSFMKDSRKSVKKLSVLLSSELHLRSKRQALLNDQTLTDLIVSLLTNYLDSVDAADQEKSLRAAGGK